MPACRTRPSVPQHASTLLPSTLCFDLFSLTKYYSFYQFYTIYAVRRTGSISPFRAGREHTELGVQARVQARYEHDCIFFPFENQYEQDTVLSARLAMPMRRAARAGPGRQEQVSLITSVPTPTWRAYHPVRRHMPPHYCAATSPLLDDDDPSRNRRDSSKIMADSRAHVEHRSEYSG